MIKIDLASKWENDITAAGKLLKYFATLERLFVLSLNCYMKMTVDWGAKKK